ncbi:MAG: phosphotransferase family protein, partial [Phycisphaerales bacterium]|nr:phosphotransferase family protein [Phycisphaerales bacterium]
MKASIMNTVQNISSGTRAISKNLKFDPKILLRWLSEHVDGVQGPIEVSEFKGGQSNPTFKLVTPERTFVLRRKPYGPLVKSAHAVDREFHIISALYPTGYPVPQPLAFCKDESVIGSQFYVMGFVEGRILWDGTLPGMSPGERRSIYFE